MGLPSPRQGNCSSVIGLIVDEGADGLWKLITGDENQYVWTGPHYPNSSTDFDSQVGNHLSSFERHSESVAHRTRPAAAAATPAKLEPGWLSRTLLTLFYRHACRYLVGGPGARVHEALRRWSKWWLPLQLARSGRCLCVARHCLAPLLLVWFS